ncbi:MAG: NADH-quinone oxidoreductase subunit NuoN, partial [Fimbriimonadaceae bacterium]|nr:NADH-quinone oxidoreductase subunit NuoN [Alphaproteobacteria bacterium]
TRRLWLPVTTHSLRRRTDREQAMEPSNIPNLIPALPEIVLVVGAMVLLMFGAFNKSDATETITSASIFLLVFAAILVMIGPADGTTTFGNAFISDAFSQMMKIMALIGSLVAIILSRHYFRMEKFSRFEFPILILLANVGMMMMISAGSLISLYMGLELQSLALYVIAAIQRDSLRATEAGLKYFVLGALASGMMLYGMSLIYGFTGSTEFVNIAQSAAANGAGLGLIFGLVFLLAGLAFKVSAVPFHMWTPDVYEGAPTPVTAFFAAAPKIAAMAIFVRVMVTAFPNITPEWQQIVVFISIASMILGAFAAIGQRNIKRLMAYSSIGHMGFALVGLAAGSQVGVRGVIIYLAIYLAMTAGTFACILAMRRHNGMVEDIDDLAGLNKTNPMLAFLFAMLMFSLAGIPPLAGFFGKFYVFLAAIEAGLVSLAVIGVLSSVVGAFYYLRIVKIIYFDEPRESFEPVHGSLKMVLGVSAIFVIFFVAYPGPLMSWAETAAASLF